MTTTVRDMAPSTSPRLTCHNVAYEGAVVEIHTLTGTVTHEYVAFYGPQVAVRPYRTQMRQDPGYYGPYEHADSYVPVPDTRVRCGCEHSAHFPDLPLYDPTVHAYAAVPAGRREAMYVGPVCDRCAETHMAEYMESTLTCDGYLYRLRTIAGYLLDSPDPEARAKGETLRHTVWSLRSYTGTSRLDRARGNYDAYSDYLLAPYAEDLTQG